ncbi:MAG: alkene reductase [Rhodocyclaceae bacterium]|nr:alkene reductase [Rhodocyclaceae bacterium]
MPDLFTPLKIGRLTLPNRIVMAPMTRNRAPETIANALMAEYYAQRASAGLIISEGSQISPTAVGYPATPGIHSPEQIAGWRLVTDAVHAKGGRIFLQLWHCGRISHPDLIAGAQPVSSSAVKPQTKVITWQGPKDAVTPHALSREEIATIVADYAQAAKNALAAGFDGVEIHAANGYLIDQFLRDGVNRRNDEYGGSVANRCRFLLQVTQAVVDAVGADRVGVRLSPWQPFNDMADSNPQALFCHAVEALNPFGLAYLHITEMGRENPGAAGPDFDPMEFRRRWKGLLITNAGYAKARAQAALASGLADAIAFGVPFIANPDLVERFRGNHPLNAADPRTFYTGGARGYLDYPTLNHGEDRADR